MLSHSRALAVLAIQERDRLEEALRVDLSDERLQDQLADLRHGRADGWYPAGQTTLLISEIQPRYGLGSFEQTYEKAAAEAVQAGVGAFLLPKLEALFQSHEQLRLDAQLAYEQSSATLTSYAKHCDDLDSVTRIVAVQDEVGGEAVVSTPGGPKANMNTATTGAGGAPRKWDDLVTLADEMKEAEPGKYNDQKAVNKYNSTYARAIADPGNKRERAEVHNLRDARNYRSKQNN